MDMDKRQLFWVTRQQGMHVFIVSYCREPIKVVFWLTVLGSVFEHVVWIEMWFFSVSKLAMLCSPFINMAQLMINHWTKDNYSE